MFRKATMIAALLIGAGSLAACSGVPRPPVSPATDTATANKIEAIASGIASGVQTACGYIIEAQPVIDIAATLVGVGSIAAAVENAVAGVCRVLKSKSVRRGGALPRYRGVVLRYRRA